MKRFAALFLLTTIIGLMCDADVLARGPGGGGRGGGGRVGGGVSRPSPSVSRSPSMSRPTPSVSRPSTGAVSRPSTGGLNRPSTGAITRPGTGATTRPSTGSRPTQANLQNFLDLPKPSTGAITRPATGVRPGVGNLDGNVARPGGAAGEFLQNRPPQAGQLPARPGVGDRPIAENRPDRIDSRVDRVDNRAGRIDNRQEWTQNRVDRRDQVRDQVRDHYPRLDFWSNYPNWARWRVNRPYRWATWAVMTSWFPFGWNQPTYYNYGDNVYYQDNSVYYGDQQICSADEYTQQAEAIATSAPPVEPDKTEWMPLGVFALTQDGEASGAEPSMFLQLVVSKEGIISGTFQNKATDATGEIEGMVDRASQRAAWTAKGQNRPLVETGVNNLTQDTAPVLIHFADGQTQQMLLVRLEDPAVQP